MQRTSLASCLERQCNRRRDYRMQYFDLGLMKYQEIKNASGKHDHLKRFFYEEINKFSSMLWSSKTRFAEI